MKVLIVPDKFKGSLTSAAAASAIAAGWRRERPDDTLECLPMSDGGDGFGPVLGQLLGAQEQVTETVDAAGRPRRAPWWWAPAEGAAIIESAQTIGLALLPPKQFHPFQLDTFGLGAHLRAAQQLGVTRGWVGIGGSATNDAGFGMARALGWQFYDRTGSVLKTWTDLERLAKVTPPGESAGAAPTDWVVAVDVQNPLLGPSGATRVYGPQKGLRPEDFPLAERCLGQLASVLARDFGWTGLADEPGTGAAGGLGFGFRAFLRARLQSGFSIYAQLARLEEKIRAVDLVVSGEGAIDEQTAMGKGVGEIATLCRRCGIACVALAGRVALPLDRPGAPAAGFERVYAMVPYLADPPTAMARAVELLPDLAAQAARECARR